MDFEIKIDNKKSNNNHLSFDIYSDNNSFGLDKSIINSLRRILLSSIKTLSFKTSYDDSDIIINNNNTSLHNEFLSHRISLIPLYINPEDYYYDHLFYLNEKCDKPFQQIFCKNFKIYPLKKNIDKDNILPINKNNYDFNNPLSQEEKDEIFKPFINPFNKNKEYCLITELKNNQSLELYGSPSIGTSYNNSKWQAVSKACYSFKKDDKKFQEILDEKVNIELIKKLNDKLFDDIQSWIKTTDGISWLKDFKKELELQESERYFYRDDHFEPCYYEFYIESQHFLNSKQLFIQSIEILIEQFENVLKPQFNLLNSNDDDDHGKIMNLSHSNNVYKILIQGYDDTIGNLIQSFMSRYIINDDSFIHFCGYQKLHPLKKEIILILSLNMNHKNYNETNSNNIHNFINELNECSDLIINLLSEIKQKTIQNL